MRITMQPGVVSATTHFLYRSSTVWTAEPSRIASTFQWRMSVLGVPRSPRDYQLSHAHAGRRPASCARLNLSWSRPAGRQTIGDGEVRTLTWSWNFSQPSAPAPVKFSDTADSAARSRSGLADFSLRPLERSDVPDWDAYLSLPAAVEHTSWNLRGPDDLRAQCSRYESPAPESPCRFAVVNQRTNRIHP